MRDDTDDLTSDQFLDCVQFCDLGAGFQYPDVRPKIGPYNKCGFAGLGKGLDVDNGARAEFDLLKVLPGDGFQLVVLL